MPIPINKEDSQADIEKTHEKFKHLINSKAFQFHKKTGFNFEELKAEANYIFCLSYQSYDKNKGQFSTYLITNLNYKLYDYIKNRLKTEEFTSFTFFDKEPFYFFQNSLSQKSQQVIFHIFNSAVESHTGKVTKTSLSLFLNNQGWERKDIRECYREITKKLKEKN